MFTIKIQPAGIAHLELLDRLRDDADFDWPVIMREDGTDVNAGTMVFEAAARDTLIEFSSKMYENFGLLCSYTHES